MPQTELLYLSTLARQHGAQVTCDLEPSEDGAHLSVSGLPGHADLAGNPCQVLQGLRSALGDRAMAPKLFMHEGVLSLYFSAAQLEVYGEVQGLLDHQRRQNQLRPGCKFQSIAPGAEPDDLAVRLWQNQGADLVEFATRADFDAQPETLMTQLRTYRYDLSDLAQKAEYVALCHALSCYDKQGVSTRFANHHRMAALEAHWEQIRRFSDHTVHLDIHRVYANQCVIAAVDGAPAVNLQVQNWAERSGADWRIKEGYYLEPSPELNNLRAFAHTRRRAVSTAGPTYN